MANDTNRVSIAGVMVEHVDTEKRMNVTVAGMMVEHTDTVKRMNVTIAGMMVEHKPPLPPLVTSGGEGPAAQII